MGESIEQRKKVLDKFEDGIYENKNGIWIYTETRKVQYQRKATEDEIGSLKGQRCNDVWSAKMRGVLKNCARLMRLQGQYTFNASIDGYEFKIRKEGGEYLW